MAESAVVCNIDTFGRVVHLSSKVKARSVNDVIGNLAF